MSLHKTPRGTVVVYCDVCRIAPRIRLNDRAAWEAKHRHLRRNPRVWASLDDVPGDVDVYDTGYRVWYVRPGYAERYYRAGDVPIVWERPAMQGPFIEVLT